MHVQVVLGGGQEAMDVTTTTTKSGKFDARFYHLVYEEEIGRVKGHFGPINSVRFHPDGKRFVFSNSTDPSYCLYHTFLIGTLLGWNKSFLNSKCEFFFKLSFSLSVIAVVVKMGMYEFIHLTLVTLNLNSDTLAKSAI